MTNKNESAAIGAIHSLERFGSKLGLERIAALMQMLGNPQDRMKCIHVAGTNGKGSVCRYIYSVLREHGYNTGIYTSPYVINFYERIEYNGEYITDSELERYTARVIGEAERMVAAGMDSPTEFEVLTAIAFLFYAEKGAEFLVLEVGLGGSGDSTNVIKEPKASVITSISLDHTERLGVTPAEIAAEKAGIIKKGCPVITFVEDEDAARIIAARAYAQNAPLIDVSRKKRRNVRKSTEGYEFCVDIDGRAYNGIEISMPGEHQIRNAACALCVIDLLRAEKLITTTAEGIRRGMKAARQPGRFEIMRLDPRDFAAGGPTGASALVAPAGAAASAAAGAGASEDGATGASAQAGAAASAVAGGPTGASEDGAPGAPGAPAPRHIELVLDGAHNEAGAAVLADTVMDLYAGRKVTVVIGVLKEKRLDAMLAQLDRIASEYIATEPENDRKLPAGQLYEKIHNNGKKCTIIADPRKAAAAAIAGQGGSSLVVVAGSLFLIGAVRGYLLERNGQGTAVL